MLLAVAVAVAECGPVRWLIEAAVAHDPAAPVRRVESSESPAHVREEIGQAHTRRIAKGTLGRYLTLWLGSAAQRSAR